MKKLQLEEMEMIEGGCRRLRCTLSVLGFIGAAALSAVTLGAGLFVFGFTVLGIDACDGC